MADQAPRPQTPAGQRPVGNFAGLLRYARYDLLSGFLVFLIALPLCLGIASAGGFPPIAGVFTAIVGSIITSMISNSELTIKGPAAGLIVIVYGCVVEFGGDGIAGGWSQADQTAYRIALGIAVAAGVLQIIFGVLRSGVLGEFFPTAAVHGMLAAIGVIIISKQFPVTIGVENKGEPLHLLASIPDKIVHLNPEIAVIGAVSLLILFGLPWIKNKYIKMIPAPMIVVLIAIPLGMYFDLSHEHTYTFFNHNYEVGEEFLVPVPNSMLSAITLPDFSGLQYAKGWKWVIMFALIGSLESLLSAKAVDLLDPWRRKTDLNRDMLAVGIANTMAAFIGGLPMISEIVRSKANTDNGARTRFADMYHGLFLLAFVALVPGLIHQIPLAALGAMLVYTGFRLASPKEFVGAYKIGWEQLLVFVTTIVAVLATDLLIGVAIGVAVEFLIQMFHYAPIRSLLISDVTIHPQDARTIRVELQHAAVFSNWISIRRRLNSLDQNCDVILDMSHVHLIDHTVMEKLHEMEQEFEEAGRKLHVAGLEHHKSFSNHPRSTRRKVKAATSPAQPASPLINGHAGTSTRHNRPEVAAARRT
jgi:MFS superfamily sulfate permease-like transporter